MNIDLLNGNGVVVDPFRDYYRKRRLMVTPAFDPILFVGREPAARREDLFCRRYLRGRQRRL